MLGAKQNEVVKGSDERFLLRDLISVVPGRVTNLQDR
jgi:hypothetical protein